MYEQYYTVNPENGNVIIDIGLKGYSDYFHEWDNASLRFRDINNELADYLDLCSTDIPLKKKIEIKFTIHNDRKNGDKETEITNSFMNYYTFLYRVEKRTIQSTMLQALLLALISVVFIFSYFYIDRLVPSRSIWLDILVEGLIIGGWVFMWEALHTVSFQILKNVKRKNELKRFLKASIIFD